MNKLFLIDVKLKPGASAPSILESVFPITFTNNITIIVGENGSGKSTLLEAIAVKLGCNAEGGGRNFNFITEATHSSLHQSLQLSKGYRREKDLFFYRAETFYNLNSEIRRLDSQAGFGPPISAFYGGRDLHSLSHGEAMEALYQNRFKPNGLYILDEPEASLSPTRQLSFMLRVAELASRGAQFIMATHSPLLMLIPQSEVRCIENGALLPLAAQESVAFSIYKAALAADGRFIHNLFSGLE